VEDALLASIDNQKSEWSNLNLIGDNAVDNDAWANDFLADEREANDVPADELDFEYEEDFDDAEQERLQATLGEALHEGGDLGDSEDSDSEDAARTSADSAAEAQQSVERTLESTLGWCWTMPTTQRWALASALVRHASRIAVALRLQAEEHVEEKRRHKAEAAAQGFKKSRLIGATVVGATRRLEALRAAEPFAMVVEEACEVMEPTIMSVLSVRSLRKLELIGDHRQLPAFVQNCWFNLERTHPSIKISLFERLVTGGEPEPTDPHRRAPGEPAAGVAPCTILDEQRRMRPAIADLTRGDYADLVKIADHATTCTQRVGDKLERRSPSFAPQRALWADEGRRVPGVAPQEFFWDLRDNTEGKPKAGLSACNYVEAEAAVGLALWLIRGGVPPPSITIITPYKGQLMAIRDALRKAGALSRTPFLRGGRGGRGDARARGRGNRGSARGQGQMPAAVSAEAQEVVVSTVDRYQGDEVRLDAKS
jgi:hypothetical protein